MATMDELLKNPDGVLGDSGLDKDVVMGKLADRAAMIKENLDFIRERAREEKCKPSELLADPEFMSTMLVYLMITSGFDVQASGVIGICAILMEQELQEG